MSEAAPLVSVVVPIYNSARYLATTIRAVLDQTLGDFELIVVDDASTDDSLAIVAGFDDPRIRAGAQRAQPRRRRQLEPRAWRRCAARYVKLLCADDLLYPTCLERQAGVLDEPGNAGVALVTAPHDVVDESGQAHHGARAPRQPGRLDGREAIRRIARARDEPRRRALGHDVPRRCVRGGRAVGRARALRRGPRHVDAAAHRRATCSWSARRSPPSASSAGAGATR